MLADSKTQASTLAVLHFPGFNLIDTLEHNYKTNFKAHGVKKLRLHLNESIEEILLIVNSNARTFISHTKSDSNVLVFGVS